MKKRIFIGVWIFFALLLIAAIVAPFLIDINYFRPTIEKKLEEQLNAKVSLGNLKLSIIKGIGAEIEGIRISNPPGYSDAPLLEVNHAKIYLGTFKSLFGSPTAKITLLKPKIRIEKNELGRLNVKDLIKSKKEGVSSEIPKSIVLPAGAPPAGVIGSVMLRGSLLLTIEEGELVYQKNSGQKNNETISVKNLSFKSGPLSLKNPIQAEIKGIVSQIRHPKGSLEGGFQCKAKISNPIKIGDPKKIELHEKISFDLSLDGSEMILHSPFFSKKKGEKMDLTTQGSYTAKQIQIDHTRLLFPFGQLDTKGSINDFSSFQGELKLLFVTPPATPSEPQLFQSDLDLSMAFSASLKPFLIENAKGEINIRKLSGEIPAFLRPLFIKQKVDAEGSASLRGRSHFQIKNNKPTKIDFENMELDLGPIFLNYDKKWSKPKAEALILKLSGALEQLENRRQLTLSSSSIQFGKMLLNASGKVSLAESTFVDLSLSSNVFAAESFKRYLPPLPFTFKGPIEISKLTLLGDPKNRQNLNIQGKISAQKGYLEFNPSYYKEKKWSAQGPIHFSASSDFAISGKKLTSLKLNMNADFTEAALRLEKSFIKPAQKRLEFAFSSSLEKDLMRFEKLNLEFHNMRLFADGTLSHFSEKQKRHLSLLLSTDSFSLSEWNQFFPSIQKPFDGTAEIKNLRLDIPFSAPKDLAISGKIALNKISGEIPRNLIKAKNLELEGPFLIDLVSEMEIKKKEIKRLNLAGNMNFTNMAISFTDKFQKPKQIPFEMTLHAQSTADTLTIQNTNFKLKDLLIELSGQVAQLRHKPNYTLDLSTSSFSLDELGQFIPAVKNRHILGNMRVEAQFRGKPTDAATPLYLGFQINSSELTYTPPAAAQEGKEEKAQESLKITETNKPDEKKHLIQKGILDRLQMTGKLKATKALVKDYRLWNLSASLSLKDKILEMSPLQFQFYDGKFSSKTKIDLNKKEPKTEIAAVLEKLNVDKFLTAQKSKAAGKFTGLLDAKLNLSMRGKNSDQIKSSMNGNGEITVRDGMFKIFNLSESLADVPIIPQVAPNFKLSDEFDIFKTSLLVKNQRVENPDMLLQGKNHLIKCQGALYFDGSLDYKGSYFLAQKEDYRKEIPFVVTGTISKPKPVPDVGKLLQNTVQGVFEKILTPKTEPEPPSEPEGQKPETNPLEDLLKGTILK